MFHYKWLRFYVFFVFLVGIIFTAPHQASADERKLPLMVSDDNFADGGNPYGWWDDGSVVRLDNILDLVGIGTVTPAGKLHVVGGNAIFEGNVGIGTTNPQAPLHIFTGTGSPQAMIRVQSAPGTFYPKLELVDSSGTFALQNNMGVMSRVDITAGSFGIYGKTDTGNVGIGTTTPNNRLTIQADDNRGIEVNTGANTVVLTPRNVAWANSPLIDLINGEPSGKRNIIASTASGLEFVDVSENSAWIFRTLNGVGRMRIDSSGNVGIGTSSPAHKLVVSGIGSITSLVESQGGGTGTIQASGADARLILNRSSSGQQDYIIFQTAGAPNWVLGNVNSNSPNLADFKIFGYSAGGDVVTIKSDTGNVGIGTMTPGQKLSVAGTIESTSGGFKFPDGTTQTTAGGAASLWTASGSDIYNANSGNVGIGATNPSAKLDVAGDIQWSGTLLAGAVPWQRLTGVPTFVGGSGTSNYLAKFTAGTTIGNSSIFDNGNVGIGTVTPGAKLDVNGSVKMNGFQMATGASSGYVLTSDSAGTGTWQPAAVGGLTLPYAGSVDTDGAVFQITNTHSYGSSSAIRGVSSNFGVIGTEPIPGAGYGTGVYGASFTGVEGIGSPDGTGVKGTSYDGIFSYGVWGISNTGYAGYFDGAVHVAGIFTASTKLFKIDHPLDPSNKYLSHASVESSEMLTLYTGNVVLDSNGTAWVELPSWFETLNTDFRYHLTSVGAAAPGLYICDEMQNNRFRIAGGLAGLKVSWQVTAVRQDAYAKAHPLQVEQDKPSEEQGFYQNPELYGQSETRGMSYAHKKNVTSLNPKPSPKGIPGSVVAE